MEWGLVISDVNKTVSKLITIAAESVVDHDPISVWEIMYVFARPCLAGVISVPADVNIASGVQCGCMVRFFRNCTCVCVCSSVSKPGSDYWLGLLACPSMIFSHLTCSGRSEAYIWCSTESAIILPSNYQGRCHSTWSLALRDGE